MVLFNWGWSHFTNKLFLIRSLNLFVSEGRTSKSLSNCYIHVDDQKKRSPVILEIPMYDVAPVKKCQYVLP